MGENNKTEKKKGKPSLAMQIFLALVLAIICGLLLQNHSEFAEHYIKPFGTIFLNLVKFIVVPVVLFSIMCGIISMQDIRRSVLWESIRWRSIFVPLLSQSLSDCFSEAFSADFFR